MLHRSGKSGDLSLFLVSGSFSSLSLIVAELFTYDLYSVEVNSALQKSVYSRVLLFIVMTHTKDTRYAAVTNFFYVSQKKMSLLFSAPPIIAGIWHLQSQGDSLLTKHSAIECALARISITLLSLCFSSWLHISPDPG